METGTLKYSMKMVSKLSGLTPYVIRTWERRYGMVEPGRTDTNRCLYSEEEVDRLILLRRATEDGHSIGSIARLGDAELENLTRLHTVRETPQVVEGKDSNTVVAVMLACTRELDSSGLGGVRIA